MTNYTSILQEFKNLNYNEGSQLSETDMKRALDLICTKNAGIR